MKLIVTGGTGFLGSHICKRLLEKDYEVICIDNFLTGKKKNISNFIGNPKFKLIEHDIINPIDIAADGIFNLACPASPPKYQSNPIYTSKISFMGTYNLLNLAHRNKIRFLQASTSEIYGDPLVHPQNEKYYGNVNPFGPRSCYDEGKRIAETLCYDFHIQKGLDIRIPRIFNTYGPGMSIDDGRVVTSTIKSALKNEDVIIFGDGKQTRSFCYVDDLIDGILKLFFSNDSKLNSPINLGNPSEININHLAYEVINLTNSKSKLKFVDLPMNDPLQRQPDISKANKILGWHPKTSLRDGLTKTINYIKNN